ncbi:hypothetical protein ARMGADRAFT_1030836 [Armillaria gallica]|uniref:Uncharacterized protein n=1 Tax=Armillaria gallica TaxID=47427 RepID=A0A2H3DWA6_ARMGA|nr:hypothetical protein ARMGADRAFT_1030836 [Armillaria gallica]
MGIVEFLKKGDQLVMPFKIAYTAKKVGWLSALMSFEVSPAGLQEYVQVPFADFNALKLPPGTSSASGDGRTEQPNAVLEVLIKVVQPTEDSVFLGYTYVLTDPRVPDSAAAKYVHLYFYTMDWCQQ